MLSFRFDRFPIQVDRSEYEDVAAVIEERVVAIPGLAAIYALGSVTAPGISDLDRVIVADRDVGPTSFGWGSLSPRERYVAMHTPFMADIETFAVHRWFAFLSPLTLLWGEPIAVESPPTDAGIATRLGIEHLVMTRVRLEKVLFTARVKVRPMLCELNNLRHDLVLAGLTEEEAPTAWAVVREVADLRSNWWHTTRAEQVERMGRLPEHALHGLDEALVAWTRSVAGDSTEPNSIGLYGYWSNVTLTDAPADVGSETGWTVPHLLERRSRRASELRWRRAGHRVSIPGPALALLADARAGRTEALAIRREHIARYLRFMSSHSGWSSIGVIGGLYA